MKEFWQQIKDSPASEKCPQTARVHECAGALLSGLRARVEAAAGGLGDLEIDLDRFEQGFLREVLELEAKFYDVAAEDLAEVREELEKDYDDSVQVMKFFNLLNSDGQSYTADYGEFANKRFILPGKEEILKSLTPGKFRLYQKMKADGLEPKLQITPIAFEIRTLGKRIDAKKAELEKEMGIGMTETYVSGGVGDAELRYEPTSVKAVKGGKKIKITGGVSKSEWIKRHGGFLVDFVPMKQNLKADPEVQMAADRKTVNFNAVQADKYFTKLGAAGLKPMSYESYLLAQMRALKAGVPLEKDNYTLLLGSNLTDSQYLAYGGWGGVGVDLGRFFGADRLGDLRLRGSVGVL